MGAFTNGSANSFTAKNNKLTFSHSTSHGICSIQDYVYGTMGYFQNNTLRLEEGAKAYVVVGENFVNPAQNDTKASFIMKDKGVWFWMKITAILGLNTVSVGKSR